MTILLQLSEREATYYRFNRIHFYRNTSYNVRRDMPSQQDFCRVALGVFRPHLFWVGCMPSCFV